MDKIRMNVDELDIREIGVWPLEYRLIGVVIFGLLVLMILYLLIVKSHLNQLNISNSNVNNLITTFRETYQQSANLELYSKQMSEMEKMLKGLLKKLPVKGELTLLLEDISQQAVSAGLTFELIKPEVPIDKGFYFEQPIQMVLTGKYHGFGRFAAGLAGLSRIVTLHDFSIKSLQPNNNQSASSMLTIETKAKTYWYVDKEQL